MFKYLVKWKKKHSSERNWHFPEVLSDLMGKGCKKWRKTARQIVFIDVDYDLIKSLATQIPHDAGLALKIPPAPGIE